MNLGWLLAIVFILSTDACLNSVQVSSDLSSWASNLTYALSELCDGGTITLDGQDWGWHTTHCNVQVDKSVTFVSSNNATFRWSNLLVLLLH